MSEPALEVIELSKTYFGAAEPVEAVKGATFSAAAGEFLAIVGPSGSGKTTLLAMIGGLLSPTSGTVRVDGVAIDRLDARKLAAFRRRRVGFVFQSNNLIPYLTARENLLLMADIGGVDRKTARVRADRLLEELGLAHRANALATELSGGERQRVAIARALMNDPALILVDEPTAALDSARGRQVVESLKAEIKSRNKLGIMVTHDLAMAALTDRILEMHDGVLRELSPTASME
ncbi:MAG: ABC transporter ATP-binding protein [Chloroflexota bacterium]|jgi:putative ABC transport system ATP-binding protein|nr:ABC transporter ATP-binding protein [Dehalococcoidia bacterium]MDW8045918.1 ABC transporter ATP-binding protein [Chloroflexota bacterium]